MEKRTSLPPVKNNYSSVYWYICNYLTGQLEVGTPVESQEFETNLRERIKWKFSIAAKRDLIGWHVTEFILRRAATCTGPSYIVVKVSLTIMDGEGNISTDITRDERFRNDTEIIFRTSDMYDSRVATPLRIKADKITVRCDFLQDSTLCVTESDTYADLLSLSNDLRFLYLSGNLADLDLIVGEVKCSVHSTVLKARSPYVARILSQNPHVQQIDLTEICFMPLLKNLTVYWYSGDLEELRRIPCSSTSNAIQDFEQNELQSYIDPEKIDVLTIFEVCSRSISWFIDYFHFQECIMHSDRSLFRAYQSEDQTGELFFYPNGFSGNEKHIALRISKTDRVDFNVQCVEVFFIGEIGTEYGCKIAETFTSTMYAFPIFITHAEFSVLRERLLNENIIRIGCRFSCPAGNIKHYVERDSDSEVFTEHPYTNLANDMKKLLHSEDTSDISLKSGDRIFRVHKAILAARSRYFDCLFQKLKYESPKPIEISVDDIEPGDLDMILKYVYYAEKIVLTLELAVKLYPVFYKYEITRLYNLCSDFLHNNVNVENAFGILELAETFNDSSLKQTAHEIILENWNRDSQSKNWSGLVSGKNELASEIMRSVIRSPCFIKD